MKYGDYNKSYQALTEAHADFKNEVRLTNRPMNHIDQLLALVRKMELRARTLLFESVGGVWQFIGLPRMWYLKPWVWKRVFLLAALFIEFIEGVIKIFSNAKDQ